MTRKLYEQEIAKHLLSLREALVRHDENQKAWVLMSECTPYFLRRMPEVYQAYNDQLSMVEHLLDPSKLAEYYGNNPYEKPFEEQYDCTVSEANRIPRVSWLRERLEGHAEYGMHLDLGANDGWMLFHLLEAGVIAGGSGVDLSYDAVARANHERNIDVRIGRIEDAVFDEPSFNSVSCFEVLEHVADPQDILRIAHRELVHGGRAYFSTPFGACELGDIPNWDYVEPKGHVRAWEPSDFILEVRSAGFETGNEVVVDPHGLMLLEATKV